MEKLREGGFLITKIRELSQLIFNNLLKENKIDEISAAQGRVIFPLWHQDNISFQDLKKKTMLSKATLSYMLDKLEEAGHIERVRSKIDKRTITIKLTKKNEALQEKFLQVSNEMKDIFYKDFSEKEIDEFEGYLRRQLKNLTEFSKKDK
ncbi:MAG: MarR family transcriptional regulator [Candidatus Lokiarchaeota archaeon]|nr:MarR family transcriptional regulator [Candidatus Lokiarchaeota archaeon]